MNLRQSIALTLALASFFSVEKLYATDFWVNGDKIYTAGEVESDDGTRLSMLYERLKAEGHVVTTVVFRNNPGGDLGGGLDMSNIIRDNGLNTSFEGGCYSACALAYSAGVQRGMARYDLPPIYFGFDRDVLGFHGASISEEVAPVDVQDIVYGRIYDLLKNDLSPGGQVRLHEAIYDMRDSQAFLRYFDPASANATPVFCPTGDWENGDTSACTFYPGVTMYSDGMVTQQGYTSVTDKLDITGTASGDLNPHFHTDNDSYGIVRVGSGGIWNLDTVSNTYLTWVDKGGTVNLGPNGRFWTNTQLVVSSGGTLNLDGGVIATTLDPMSYVSLGSGGLALIKKGGMLMGHGAIASDVIVGGAFAPTGITVRPYADFDAYSLADPKLQLAASSTTVLNVSPRTTSPLLTSETAEVVDPAILINPDNTLQYYGVRVQSVGTTLIASGASLNIGFQHGFYKPGQIIPLFGSTVRTDHVSAPAGCICDGFDQADPLYVVDQPNFSGHFSNYVRASDGRVIALEPTAAKQSISVSEGALLGFDLVYVPTEDIDSWSGEFTNNYSAMYLVAKPAFDDVSVFANAASGAGLGQALKDASYRDASGNAALLGALEFANASTVRSQSGTLRGDAHASQGLDDLIVGATLDGLQSQHVAALLGDRATQQSDSGAPTMRPGISGFDVTQGVGGPSPYAAGHAPDENDGLAGQVSPGGTVWGRVVAFETRIHPGQGVEHLDAYHSGLIVGTDRTIGDDSTVLGGSIAYLRGNGSSDGLSYHDRSDIWSAGVYGDLMHARGELSGALRLSHFGSHTRRSITGIDGLQVENDVSYGRVGLAAHIENALDLPQVAKFETRIYLPTFSYQSIESTHFVETGGPARLAVHARQLESARVGTGVQFLRDIVTTSAGTFTPLLRLSYQHELDDVASSVDAAFADQPDLGFPVHSQQLGRNITEIGLGLSHLVGDKLVFSMEYDKQFRHGQSYQAGYARVSLSF